jgi:5-formyltetrahydrofolate cyclo-ligase
MLFMHKTFNKKELRVAYLTKRKSCTKEMQQACSVEICKKIINSSVYQKSNRIGFYSVNQQEIDLTCLWQLSMEQGKISYFPIIASDQTLRFAPSTQTTLWFKNCYGIKEPHYKEPDLITADELDLLILPLVAFDKHCHRLGMGLGYYDKTLAKNRPKMLIGAAYAFQYLRQIPVDPWDVNLDMVVTEQTIYKYSCQGHPSAHS